MQGLLMIGCLLLLIAVGCFVHHVWSIKREIQKHHDWLKAFQAEDARQEQEFRRKLRGEELQGEAHVGATANQDLRVRDRMIVILLLHMTGGAKSVTGTTVCEASAKARAVSERFPGSYVCATLPFEARPGQYTQWDTTPPASVKATWELTSHEKAGTLLALYHAEG